MDRDRLDLCGFWRFQPDPYAEGDALGFSSEELDTRLWREVRVPCGFDRCGPGLETYEGPGWYRRGLLVPESWRGQAALLRFEGINNRSRLWVNGHLVAESDLPWLPVKAEVSRHLRPGEANTLTAWADSTRRPQDVPGRQRGWRTSGGILRECSLTAAAPRWIDDLWVDAVPSPGGGDLIAHASARALGSVEDTSVRLSVLAPDGAEVLSLASNSLPVRAGGVTSWELSSSLKGAQPWSPERPALYQAVVTLCSGGREVDRQTRRFGFRRIEISEGDLRLNGSRLFLTGFNRHEDTPGRGPLPDLARTREDLEAMKEAGCNYVRLCHYPHHSLELDLCDELGLLVMSEIPLYWWNGLQEGEEACGAKLDAARRQVEAMIRRDRSHPSVIFWSVGNETSEALPEVSEGNAQLVRLARELDPTRLAVHVSDKWPHTPHFEEDDCLCLNAYPSWGGRCWSANPAYDPARSAEWWREEIESLKALYPGKPVIVTECGYPALEGIAEGA
ncbi:MAG TPA: glycoside hydrolase family 2 TIM barrel-domain containing protein, partial [Armatimonadota bacterium]